MFLLTQVPALQKTLSVNACKTPLLATFLGASCDLIVEGVGACSSAPSSSKYYSLG